MNANETMARLRVLFPSPDYAVNAALVNKRYFKNQIAAITDKQGVVFARFVCIESGDEENSIWKFES